MKRSLMLIFFCGLALSYASAQNIFTTQVHSVTSSSDAVTTPQLNTFTIDEPAKLFTHIQGSSEVMYSILSRTLEGQLWRYDLVNAEGVLITVRVDQGFKNFNFHSSTDPEYLHHIYSNQ